MTPSFLTLANGLRIIHIRTKKPIAYLGVAINAGTRDELPNEIGVAHFTEHMLFKGTKNLSARQLINHFEGVGGRIDAYTTKEETYIYTTIPAQYTLRALKTIADIVQHSTFAQEEIKREKDVIKEEIEGCNDTPQELIYDEFESLLFEGNTLSRNILGTAEGIEPISTETIKSFVKRLYIPQRMVFFYMGKMSLNDCAKAVEKYFSFTGELLERRLFPDLVYPRFEKRLNKETCQAHCMIGKTFQLGEQERVCAALVNNIIGGPNLSSRLNMAVREKNGLCYTIESTLTDYSDVNMFNTYFGCEQENIKRVKKLALNELRKIIEKPLSAKQLLDAKKQFTGQLLISNEDYENVILSLSRLYLLNRTISTTEQTKALIEAVTATDIQEMAFRMFDPESLSELIII